MANGALSIPKVILQKEPGAGSEQLAEMQRAMNQNIAAQAANRKTAYSTLVDAIDLPMDEMWDNTKAEQIMQGRDNYFNSVVGMFQQGVDPTDIRGEANRKGMLAAKKMEEQIGYAQKLYKSMGEEFKTKTKEIYMQADKDPSKQFWNHEASMARLDEFRLADFGKARQMLDEGLLVPKGIDLNLFKMVNEAWDSHIVEQVSRTSIPGEEITYDTVIESVTPEMIDAFVEETYALNYRDLPMAIRQARFAQGDPTYDHGDPTTWSPAANKRWLKQTLIDRSYENVEKYTKATPGASRVKAIGPEKTEDGYVLNSTEFSVYDPFSQDVKPTASAHTIPLTKLERARVEKQMRSNMKNVATGDPARGSETGDFKKIEYVSVELLPTATKDVVDPDEPTRVIIPAGGVVHPGRSATMAASQGAVEYKPHVTFMADIGQGRRESLIQPVDKTHMSEWAVDDNFNYSWQDLMDISKQLNGDLYNTLGIDPAEVAEATELHQATALNQFFNSADAEIKGQVVAD